METAGRIRREDRLSKLGDGVLGHVLSFLPAKEAARAAALSARWRDVFAGVHAVSLEQPENPIPDYKDASGCGCPDCTFGQRVDPNPTPPFTTAVTAALLSRHRRQDRPAPPTLSALRVALNWYRPDDPSTVDHWISYALKQAAAPGGLELDLRLRREGVCSRAYSLRPGGAASLKEDDNVVDGTRVTGVSPSRSPERVVTPRSLSPAGGIPDVGGEEQPTFSRRRRRRLAFARSVSGGAADPVLDSDEEVASRRAKTPRRSSTSRSPSSSHSGSQSFSRSGSDRTDSTADSGEEEVNRRAKTPRRRSTSRSPSSSRSQSFSRSGYSTADSGEEEVNRRAAPRRRKLTPNWEASSDDDHRRQRLPSRSPDRHEERARRPRSLSPLRVDKEDDIVSTDDEMDPPASPRVWSQPPPEYKAPPMLFSCAVLRSLRIGPCRLSPPAAVSLPSLEELLLTRVSDDGEDVQRLISACPRLADITLEACDTVTALSLLDCGRLRRFALRCCHKLATVAVDASGELHTLEYRGAVPDQSFLTMHGGGGSITSCKVDICGEEFSSVEELTKLRDFLQLLAPSTKHLQLQSARLGSSIEHDAMATFPTFPHLRHLELRGRLPHDDTAVVGAVRRILQHSPSLEVLTLVFETAPDVGDEVRPRCSWHDYKEGELLDAHHLRYDEHDVLLAAAPPVMIPCLRNRVREINLVHYHGGRAQRTLAKFLLRNAPLLEQLYSGFARGPLWIQTKLKDEIHGWAMNKPGNRIFS